jgi:hypothetical protein
MPKGQKDQKRPAYVISNAATLTDDGKSKAAVELGRKGGLARAKSVKKADRIKTAKNAARARWQDRD